MILSEYQKYDQLRELSEYWRFKAEEKVRSMEWEGGSGTLSGSEMLVLTTAPQVGITTAITWLVHIITPRRFPNAKAVAAYCGLDPSLKVSAKYVTSTRNIPFPEPLSYLTCGDGHVSSWLLLLPLFLTLPHLPSPISPQHSLTP